jgi:hypothetical protein
MIFVSLFFIFLLYCKGYEFSGRDNDIVMTVL